MTCGSVVECGNYKFRLQIDADAIGCDEGFFASALHLDAVGPHVDFVDFVEEGQRQAAAREHDFLSAETGARQGDIAARFAIETIEEYNGNRDHDNCNDDAQ